MLRGNTLAICLAVFLGLTLGLTMTAKAQTPGRYKGEAVMSLLPDGRNMQLLKPFSYIDPKGQTWSVPAGTKTDGASIPRVLWVTYPPFTGKYRLAAVIHDYYCQKQSRTWQDTHKVFYDAMRTADVPEKTAKLMYAAVYNWGPRWGTRSEQRGPGASKQPSPENQTQFMRDLETWIERDNPSPEEIERALDAGRVPK